MNYDSNAAGRQASSYSQSRRAMLRGAMAVVTGVTAATQRASAKSESLALPPVTKNVTPFKVEVAQAALDDSNQRSSLYPVGRNARLFRNAARQDPRTRQLLAKRL
jgi:hypothetical protein